MTKVQKVSLIAIILALSGCQKVIISPIDSKSTSNNISSNSQTTTEVNEVNSSKQTSDDSTSNNSSSKGTLSTSDTSTSSASSKTTSSSNSSSSHTSSNSNTSSSISSSSSPIIIDDDYNGTYYDSINLNNTGDSLVKELGRLIESTHDPKSYDALWDGYILGDIRPGTNYLWDMYSNCNYNAYSPKRGNYSKEGDAVNREHSVPQSWFSERSPMKSDFYHVVPTDGYVNNRRSNYPFAEVDTVKYTSLNGSKLGTSSSNNITGTVFEPIDEYKGDFARIYFYMCTRYYTQVGSWGGGVFQSSYPYIKSNYFNLYLKWAKQDPVSEKEKLRNEGGYKFQGNRNPYVDHPALLYQAFDSSYEIIEKTDAEKASDIIALINKIGAVTLSSKKAIQDARSAYDKATTEVKALVSNYDVLVAAENEYKALLEQSGSTQGESTTCIFIDKSFSNSSNFSWSSSKSALGFEQERGVQFNKVNDLVLSTSSYTKGISKIAITASSNGASYTFDVAVNNMPLAYNKNTIKSGDKNVILEFNCSPSLSGELSIHITSSTANKSIWVKQVSFN